MTIVVGIALAGSDPRKLAITASSISVGYVNPNLFTKLCAEVKLSLVKIPTNWISGFLIANSSRVGASARQGEHHEAQTFTTVIFPSSELKFVPSRVSPERVGAVIRSDSFNTIADPSPEIKAFSLLLEVPPAEHDVKVKTKARAKINFISLAINA